MNLDIHVNLSTLTLIMVIELGTGVLVGWIIKEAAKLIAHNRPESFRVVRKEEYASRSYGERTPQNFFSTFGLNCDIVIVESNEEEVIKEVFYTPLGDHVKVEYKNDGGTSTSTSFLSAPIYTSTVILPIVVGFVLCATVTQLSDNSFNYAHETSLFLGNIGIHLLISGVVWFASLYWIPSIVSVVTKVNEIYSNRSEYVPVTQVETVPIAPETQERNANWMERFFWIFLILGTVCIALSWYLHSLGYMAENPELKAGYRMLISGFIFWANIPWIVMGVGCITSNLTLKDYLQPQSLYPHLIAFFVSLLFVFATGSYWLFSAGGAEMLVNYPGLFISDSGEILDSQSLNPQLIKLWWGLGVASGVATMAFMLIRVIRLPSS